jgi:hypothetical protein
VTNLKQAATLALEALEWVYGGEPLPTKEQEAITALKAALEQQAEPSQWRDMVVVSLVREGVNKHKARELADHFAAQQQAEPICPECKAAVLYECVACSSNNYPPQQQAEPVAREGFNDWWNGDYDDSENRFEKDSAAYWAWAGWQAAQRPWVGLTDEEATKIWESTDDKDSWELIKRVEAKLKERNT